jgi:hypothetical protein
MNINIHFDEYSPDFKTSHQIDQELSVFIPLDRFFFPRFLLYWWDMMMMMMLFKTFNSGCRIWKFIHCRYDGLSVFDTVPVPYLNNGIPYTGSSVSTGIIIIIPVPVVLFFNL